MGRITDWAVQNGIAQFDQEADTEVSGWDQLDGVKKKS
jgi:hypothetical protein